MKSIKTCYLFFFLPLLLAASCGDDDNMKTMEEEPSYESCCGTEPVTFSSGQGKVYVPNVFTANFDGINDVFLPFYNSHISKIEGFVVSNTDGENLYSLAAFDLANPIQGAWTGQLSDGTYHKGPFSYKMTIFNNAGGSSVIQGKACSILCDSAAVIFQTKGGCLYPVQDNGEGGYDETLPTFEKDCFNG
jgi:hypothetical protein